eukprot:2576606-Rhodomonas_salina.1
MIVYTAVTQHRSQHVRAVPRVGLCMLLLTRSALTSRVAVPPTSPVLPTFREHDAYETENRIALSSASRFPHPLQPVINTRDAVRSTRAPLPPPSLRALPTLPSRSSACTVPTPSPPALPPPSSAAAALASSCTLSRGEQQPCKRQRGHCSADLHAWNKQSRWPVLLDALAAQLRGKVTRSGQLRGTWAWGVSSAVEVDDGAGSHWHALRAACAHHRRRRRCLEAQLAVAPPERLLLLNLLVLDVLDGLLVLDAARGLLGGRRDEARAFAVLEHRQRAVGPDPEVRGGVEAVAHHQPRVVCPLLHLSAAARAPPSPPCCRVPSCNVGREAGPSTR